MNFDRRFVPIALFLSYLSTVALAVPPHPEMEKEMRESGQIASVSRIYGEARQRGLDVPTPYPVDMKALRQQDQTELHVLTILVDFWDNPADTAQYSLSHYEELLYSMDAYPTGSLRDYYRENSCDEIDIVGEVVGWFRMPAAYSYYVNGNYGWGSYPQNSQKLTEDAVYAANPYVDFSQYDNDNNGYVDALFIVHAGPGAEQTGNPNQIWSHAWVTHNVPVVDGKYVYSYSQQPDDGKIGVFAHELGHALFGLPDLYDLNYDSYGTGKWSLMSAGVWNGGGATPSHLDAWSKVKTGLTIPVNVESDQTGVVVSQVETSGVVYRLWTQGASELQYFLVENRQQVGFDASLPGSGLLIYHVDEAKTSNNAQWYPGYTSYGHYLVAVEQADGDWDLEKHINTGDNGDPWPGSSNAITFNDNSVPDSKNYAFASTMVSIQNISASSSIMYADFEVGVEASGLDLTLIPESASIQISGSGGSFSYDAVLMNYDSAPAQAQFWVKAILPGGSYYGPLMGPVDIDINGNASIQGTLNQIVPSRAPAGQYSIVGYIGTFPFVVEDSAAFTISKGNIDTGTGLVDFIDEWSSSGGFDSNEISSVQEFSMHSAFPNPFNPTTAISYKLQASSFVTLTVYDINGRKIAELVNGWRETGMHEVSFDATDLASGVYIYQIAAEGKFASSKMILIK